MPKVAKIRQKQKQKRRRRGIGYDKENEVYYIESKSRKNFYHEVHKIDDKWGCNCEYGMMNNFDGSACSHILILVWYIKYQPDMIDVVISLDEMKIN